MPIDDFVTISAEVLIQKCARTVCHSLEIVDDAQVENEEMFEVTVERTPALEENIRITPDRSFAEITIIDTDSM